MKHLILIIFASITVVGCARHRPQQAYDALASLRRIQAATQVGVLYPQYNELLIDAQARLNNAENILPDGPVNTELRLTMDSYIDAGIVWQERLRNGDEYYLTSDLEPGKSLMKKYTLVTFKMQNRMAANPDKALQAIWSHAKTRLEKLKELLPPQ